MGRPLTPKEVALIVRIVQEYDPSLASLVRMQAESATTDYPGFDSLLDIEPSAAAPRIDTIPDGPFESVNTSVDTNGESIGLLLLWFDNGYVTGLEYGWYTDEMPTEWPELDQLSFR